MRTMLFIFCVSSLAWAGENHNSHGHLTTDTAAASLLEAWHAQNHESPILFFGVTATTESNELTEQAHDYLQANLHHAFETPLMTTIRKERGHLPVDHVDAQDMLVFARNLGAPLVLSGMLEPVLDSDRETYALILEVRKPTGKLVWRGVAMISPAQAVVMN